MTRNSNPSAAARSEIAARIFIFHETALGALYQAQEPGRALKCETAYFINSVSFGVIASAQIW